MIGLGVVTIGSATTALTGATLSNTVSPTADFRVNVEGELLAEKGGNFPDSGTSSDVPVGDSTVTYYTSDSTDSTVFNELDGEGGLAAVADEESNDALHIGLALPYSEISGASTPVKFNFPDFIQLVNNTSSDYEAAFGWDSDGGSIDDTSDDQHGFETDPATGSAAVSETGGSEQLSFNEVAYMFGFEDTNDNRISPEGAESQGNSISSAPNSVAVAAGTTERIDLTIEITSSMQSTIDSFVSSNNLQTSGNPMSLVDAIYIGAQQDPI